MLLLEPSEHTSLFGTHSNGNVLVRSVACIAFAGRIIHAAVLSALTFGGGGRPGDAWTIVEEREVS